MAVYQGYMTRTFSAKISKMRVDAHSFPAIFNVPREARLLHIWSAFYVRFGTANWLNFVPLARRSFSEGGAKRSRLSFFVAWNVRNDWFFDIYIQGSKKIQL